MTTRKEPDAAQLRSKDWEAAGDESRPPGVLGRAGDWLIDTIIDPLVPRLKSDGRTHGLRRARILVGGAIGASLTCLAFLAQRIVEGHQGIPLWTLIVTAVAFFSVPVLLRLSGTLRGAALPALTVLTVILPLDAYAFGGLGAPAFLAALALPLMATFFIGVRWGIVGAAVLSLEVIGMLILARSGHAFPAPGPNGDMALMHAAATIGMLGFVTLLAFLFEHQRRVTEDALAVSERRYELAAEAANDGIFEWLPGTDDVYLSRMLEEFLGLEESAEPRKLTSFAPRLHPDDRALFEDEVPERLKSRRRFELQFRLCNEAGEYRWLDCRVLVTRKEGQATRVVGTLRDVTESRRVSALKNEFVSAVSHELRTPLTSIRGSLSLLRAGVAGELGTEKQKTLVEIAHSNSDRLLLLVNDLLDLQKIEAGELEIEREQFDLGVAVEDALDANRPYARQMGVSLESQLDEDMRLLTVSDRHRVTQVLTNLLSNAAKFSPDGSTVHVTIFPGSRQLRVEVADQGPGIPEEFVDRLFEKFARADGSDEATHAGTGLGLAISKQIIERLDGRIGYRPNPSGGSIFWFELPGRATELNVLEQTGRFPDRQKAANSS